MRGHFFKFLYGRQCHYFYLTLHWELDYVQNIRFEIIFPLELWELLSNILLLLIHVTLIEFLSFIVNFFLFFWSQDQRIFPLSLMFRNFTMMYASVGLFISLLCICWTLIISSYLSLALRNFLLLFISYFHLLYFHYFLFLKLIWGIIPG